MIMIDPVAAYLGIGKIDSFRATDVRAVLGPLKEFAEELRIFILGVMHFNKKLDVTNLLLRVSDSLAYTAAARHVVAKSEQKTLAFSFDEREVGVDKRTGNPIRRPYIVWQQEPVDITATEALQAAAESKSPSARDDAKRFLETLLSNGPVGSTEVHAAAKANGISAATFRRAKDELGIDVGDRIWLWHPIRPEAEPEAPQ
jgi:hypothetical protein